MLLASSTMDGPLPFGGTLCGLLIYMRNPR